MLRLASVVVFCGLAAVAQDTVEFEGRYWIPQFSSRLRVTAGGFGTEVDARQDLGIADTNFPVGGVRWQHGRHHLVFGYTPLDYSGDQVVSRTVVFNGRQYTLGTRIQSGLSIQHLQLGWSYDLIRAKEGRIRVGPVVEADGFLMHGRLTAPDLATPITGVEDVSAGVCRRRGLR